MTETSPFQVDSTESHTDQRRRPPLRLGLKSMLILVTLLSISAMMAGMFLSGIWAPASQSRHQLQLFPFIAATSMAPIGIPLAVYWVLRIVEAIRNRGDDA